MSRMCSSAISRYVIVCCLTLLSTLGQAADAPARFAYTVNAFDNSLASYRIDATGMLYFNGHWPAPSFPAAVAVHPSGHFVLTASKAATQIGVYRIDPVTGAANAVPGSPFPAKRARSPFFIAFHPSGRFVYVASRFDGVMVYRMDVDTGQLTQIESSPFAAGKRTRSLAVHPSGRFIYATNAYSNSVSAYSVDETTGNLTPIEGAPFSTGDFAPIDEVLVPLLDYPPEAGAVPYYVAMHPSGKYLYVANWGGGSLSSFRIDEKTGQLTPLPDSPLPTDVNPYAVAVHPSGDFVYVLSWASEGVAAYRVAPGTGELTRIADYAYPLAGEGPVAMSFLPGGRQAYVANFNTNNVSVLDVDLQTGALTLRNTVQTRSGPWSIALAPGQPSPPADIAFALDATGALLSYRQSGNGTLKLIAKQITKAHADALVASHDGRFAYLLDSAGNRVFAYRVDVRRGEFTAVPGSPFATGKNPRDLTLDINGRFLYVVNTDEDSLSVYAIDENSGALSETKGSPYRTGDEPSSVTVDAAGRYALVTNSGSNSVSVFRYMTSLSPLVFEIGKYGSPFATGKRPVDLAIDPSGKHAYVANAGSDNLSLFSIDVQSGVLKALPQSSLPTGKAPGSLAMHPDGDWLCVLNRGSHDISVFRRDRITGELSESGKPTVAGKQARLLVWGAQGRFLYVLNDGGRAAKYTLDKNSGALHPQGMTSATDATELSVLVWPVFSR